MKGRMTPEKLLRLGHLREERGWSLARIARSLAVSVSTVAWWCVREDIVPPKGLQKPPAFNAASYQRGAATVRRFTRDEDALINALAVQGIGMTAIGRRLEPARAPNTIRARLMGLARREQHR